MAKFDHYKEEAYRATFNSEYFSNKPATSASKTAYSMVPSQNGKRIFAQKAKLFK